MIERVQRAVTRARGTWQVECVSEGTADLVHLLGEGWEPFAASDWHVYLRKRERDWHAATLLLITAVGLALLVRWIVLLLLALVVVA